MTPQTRPLSLRARLAVISAFLLLGQSGLAAGVGMEVAQAATAQNGQCAWLTNTAGTFRFWNYDFLGEETDCGAVDWATNLVFYGTADINWVKTQLHTRGYPATSTDGMHMEVGHYDIGVVWDRDAGKKEIACPATGLTARHYRIYAPPELDYMWSAGWGFFVVGTTHTDANECPPIGKRHYASEEVEQHIATTAGQAGYPVWRNDMFFYNNEPYRVEGNHTWENNGYATFINM